MLLAVSAARGEWRGFDPFAVSGAAWMALVYLVFAGSIAGFTAYVWLLHHESPTKVGTYAYVNPVVAVIIGYFLGGEPLGARTVAGRSVCRGQRGDDHQHAGKNSRRGRRRRVNKTVGGLAPSKPQIHLRFWELCYHAAIWPFPLARKRRSLMPHISRRDFLKVGAAAGAIAGLHGAPLFAERASATDWVTLGKSGVKVTRLAFGTGTFNGRCSSSSGRRNSRGWCATPMSAASASLKQRSRMAIRSRCWAWR